MGKMSPFSDSEGLRLLKLGRQSRDNLRPCGSKKFLTERGLRLGLKGKSHVGPRRTCLGNFSD